MITLKDVREFLKTRIECDTWYGGKIDATKDKCIGIYSIQGSKPNIALGGLKCTSYSSKTISILVHWTNNSNTAEEKAVEVYNALFAQEGVIAKHRVIQFDMKTDEPISVGTDTNGIFEYVINLNIIYERNVIVDV